MKAASFIFLLLLAGCAAHPSPDSSVSTTSLERRSTAIVGALGLPLGSVTDVEATVVVVPPPFIIGSGVGRWYGLRVDKIHGRKVESPPTMNFQVEGTMMVKLAPHDNSLERLWRRLSSPGEYSMLLGPGEVGEAEPLSLAEIERLRSTYVGSRHNLLVYETAHFFGNPHGVPEQYGFIFGPGAEFAFESILKIFDEPSQVPVPTTPAVTAPARQEPRRP